MVDLKSRAGFVLSEPGSSISADTSGSLCQVFNLFKRRNIDPLSEQQRKKPEEEGNRYEALRRGGEEGRK